MNEAEADLCVRFAPRIRLFALSNLRDPHAADDFTQECLLAVLQAVRAGRVERRERVGAYVLGVCRMMLRESRVTTRRRADLLERFGPDLVAEVPTPAEAPLDLARLEQCMAKLAELDRAVLALAFYADKRAAEIGAELGMSAGNVRVVKHRALSRLNDCVRGGEGGSP
jgi:RNA polymerase sigma-70 factor (ECF subfamily)